MISPNDVAGFLADLRWNREGFEDRELSKTSRNIVKANLRTLFLHAEEWGYIRKSPMARIRISKPKKDERRDWHYFSPPDFLRLLRVIPTLRDKAAFATLYQCGLRFGELYSLHPSHVDLKAGYVHVKPREATADYPPFNIKDHEERTVPIPKLAARLVAGLLAQLPRRHPYLFLTPERCKLIRERWREISSQGGSWSNRWLENNARRRLQLYTGKAGIHTNGAVTLHCLRKSYGKNGARLWSPDVLKSFMGHAEISTTLEYYSKRDQDDDDRARWTLDALMRGASVPNPKLSDVQSDVQSETDPQKKVG